MSGLDSSWLSPLANIAGIIGGLLLMGFFSIPMHFINKAAANHAEELRQEQFEELREQYF